MYRYGLNWDDDTGCGNMAIGLGLTDGHWQGGGFARGFFASCPNQAYTATLHHGLHSVLHGTQKKMGYTVCYKTCNTLCNPFSFVFHVTHCVTHGVVLLCMALSTTVEPREVWHKNSHRVGCFGTAVAERSAAQRAPVSSGNGTKAKGKGCTG